MGFIDKIVTWCNDLRYADSQLKVNAFRKYITKRDIAYCYACNKYKIPLNDMCYFSTGKLQGHIILEDNEYSLIKINFNLHHRHNHIWVFIEQFVERLNEDRWEAFKSLSSVMLGCKDEFYRVKFSNILSKVFRKKQFFSPRTCSFISWWWLLCNSFTIKDGNITAIDYDRFYDCLKFILNDSHKAWKAHKAQQEAESQRKAAEERKREEERRRFWNEARDYAYGGYQRQNYSPPKEPLQEFASEYRVLGINPTRDMVIIKAAWRKLCLEYHPDKCSNNEYIKLVNSAYETLKKNIK